MTVLMMRLDRSADLGRLVSFAITVAALRRKDGAAKRARSSTESEAENKELVHCSTIIKENVEKAT